MQTCDMTTPSSPLEPASLVPSSPRALIRAEVNLERFPFFSPADTPKDSRLVYTISREQIFNGVKMEMEWKVLALLCATRCVSFFRAASFPFSCSCS